MVVSLCPITQRVCDTIMSPLVFLTEFQELFTLDCEETTSEENNATTSQVKTGWHHPLVSWLYWNKCGSPSIWYTLTLLATFHTRLSRKAFFVCFSKRYLYTVKPLLSEPPFKRTPSIKRTLSRVPKLTNPYSADTSVKRTRTLK